MARSPVAPAQASTFSTADGLAVASLDQLRSFAVDALRGATRFSVYVESAGVTQWFGGSEAGAAQDTVLFLVSCAECATVEASRACDDAERYAGL